MSAYPDQAVVPEAGIPPARPKCAYDFSPP